MRSVIAQSCGSEQKPGLGRPPLVCTNPTSDPFDESTKQRETRKETKRGKTKEMRSVLGLREDKGRNNIILSHI